MIYHFSLKQCINSHLTQYPAQPTCCNWQPFQKQDKLLHFDESLEKQPFFHYNYIHHKAKTSCCQHQCNKPYVHASTNIPARASNKTERAALIDVPDPPRYPDTKLFTACYVDLIARFFHVTCRTQSAESRLASPRGGIPSNESLSSHPIHAYISRPNAHAQAGKKWQKGWRSIQAFPAGTAVREGGCELEEGERLIEPGRQRGVSVRTFSSYISARGVPGIIWAVMRVLQASLTQSQRTSQPLRYAITTPCSACMLGDATCQHLKTEFHN